MSQKKFWLEKIVGRKVFLVRQKFWSEKRFSRKSFLFGKSFGQTNSWSNNYPMVQSFYLKNVFPLFFWGGGGLNIFF